jgi:hypothetical protein
VAEKARRGEVYLNLPDLKTLQRLKQRLASKWELRTVRHVESKTNTKKKTGRAARMMPSRCVGWRALGHGGKARATSVPRRR